MSIIELATVLIFVTSVITSPVNETSKIDGNQPQALKKLFGSSATESKNPTLLTDTRSVSSNESDAISKAEIAKQPVDKGGLYLSEGETQSSKKVPVYSEGVSFSVENPTPNSHENISESEGSKKQPSVVPRKGAGDRKKISPRKGVDYTMDLSINERPETSSTSSVSRVAETSTAISVVKTEPILHTDENTGLINKWDNKTDVVSNKNSSATVLVVPGTLHSNVTKHKPKPTSTTGEGDDDGKGMPSSPTQKQLGAPQKVDYIIPVVITIMATPVLGIAAYILYTRGRDCWDKRHYRRMDFLIDGMYND